MKTSQDFFNDLQKLTQGQDIHPSILYFYCPSTIDIFLAYNLIKSKYDKNFPNQDFLNDLQKLARSKNIQSPPGHENFIFLITFHH